MEKLTSSDAASLSGAQGSAGNENSGSQNAKGLNDPTKKYPKPPFERQFQPFPGLAHKMNPVPDHGEESYVGSGRLKGRKALITGGDSGIGRAAAIAYAREGADVVINYLPEEQSDADQVLALIEKAGTKGFGIPGDLREESFCKKLVEQAAEKLGGLDILVFTGGVGENMASMRKAVCENMEYMGIELDDDLNASIRSIEAVISKPTSKVKVVIIPTDEELTIAQDTSGILESYQN